MAFHLSIESIPPIQISCRIIFYGMTSRRTTFHRETFCRTTSYTTSVHKSVYFTTWGICCKDKLPVSVYRDRMLDIQV